MLFRPMNVELPAADVYLYVFTFANGFCHPRFGPRRKLI